MPLENIFFNDLLILLFGTDLFLFFFGSLWLEECGIDAIESELNAIFHLVILEHAQVLKVSMTLSLLRTFFNVFAALNIRLYAGPMFW